MSQLYQTLQAHIGAWVASVAPEHTQAGLLLEATKNPEHGDLASNAAMVLARPLGRNPKDLGEQLAAHCARHPGVASAEVAGPGFVNLRLKTEALWPLTEQIVQDGAAFGTLALGQGTRAMVEFVSINPTGPIHVGHGRNAVFGEAVARILQKAGYEVYREYLVNDAGNQIRVLVRSLHVRYLQAFGCDVAVPEDGYPGEYLIEMAEALKARDGERWLAPDLTEDDLLTGLRGFAVDACMDLIKADLATLDIRFDNFFSEFAMHQNDAMAAPVAALRAKGLVFEGTLPPPKGKTVADYVPVTLTLFRATAFGLPDDQPIFNRAGQPTYFGQDIAYHANKLARGFGLLVVVLGADQAGSFLPLTKAIEALTGKTGLYHPLPYEMVKTLRDGVPVKLSKRAGNIVALGDVLQEVGADAFRASMLAVKPTTILTFDLAKAVEKSMENPVFYVQYAHARLASIRRNWVTLFGMEAPEQVSPSPEDLAQLAAEAKSLLRELMLFPHTVALAATHREPHRMFHFATTLASVVHRWWGAARWLDEAQPGISAMNLQVAKAAQVVLAEALRLCAISAPERM